MSKRVSILMSEESRSVSTRVEVYARSVCYMYGRMYGRMSQQNAKLILVWCFFRKASCEHFSAESADVLSLLGYDESVKKS